MALVWAAGGHAGRKGRAAMSYQSEGGEAYGSDAVGGQCQCQWQEEVGAVGGGEESGDRLQLEGQFLPEAPVLLVVQFQEVREAGQVLAPLLLGQQSQKVAQVLQHPNSNLISVEFIKLI